jgi:hypothetical protein
VYVDGLYKGSIDDFGVAGQPLALDEGAHRLELRATGYTTQRLAIDVIAGRTLKYRGDLQPVPEAATQAPVAAVRGPARTTYVIPNCYAGDRPPSGMLPPGCDLSKMLVRAPQSTH